MEAPSGSLDSADLVQHALAELGMPASSPHTSEQGPGNESRSSRRSTAFLPVPQGETRRPGLGMAGAGVRGGFLRGRGSGSCSASRFGRKWRGGR